MARMAGVRAVVAGVVAAALGGGNAAAEPAAARQLESAPTLTMKLRKVRNTKGKVGCAVFNRPAGFPLKPRKAVLRVWCPIVGHEATCRVRRALPVGLYAAVCIHDENSNGTLDTNWVGYPTEGAVASNHAKGWLGPPKFKDAAFRVGPGPTTMRMKMGY